MIDQCAAVRHLFTYSRHHSVVNSIAYNPSRKEFVSVDKTELHSWKEQHQLSKLILPSIEYLLHLIFIREKDIYLSSCVDGSFRLYDSKVRFIRNFTTQAGVITFLLYVPKTQKLLTAGVDGVNCWTVQGSASEYYERQWVSTTNFDIRRDHTFHYERTEWVRKIVVDEPSNRFFAIWNDNIDVCDLATGKRLFLVKKMFQEYILDLLLHPITRTVIVACRAGAIHVLNDDMTYIVTSLRGHTDDTTDIHVHQPSGLLLSSSKDKTLRLWDIDRGQEVFRHALPSKCHRLAALSKTKPFKFLCLLEDGKIHHFELTYAFRYYTSLQSTSAMSMERGLIVGQDERVQIYSLNFDLEPKEFQSKDKIEGFSHDQDVIVLLHDQNRLSFYSKSKLCQRIQIMNDSFEITCISILSSFIRPESSCIDPETMFEQEIFDELNDLWIGCGTAQGQVMIFTPTDLFCVVQDVSLGFSIDYVMQNRSNQRIVTVGTDNCLRLWTFDLKRLDQMNNFHPAAVDPSCIKMSDPYHLLLCGFDDGLLEMIDIRYSKLKFYRAEMNHHASVVAADFLESKPVCLTSSVDKTIKLWDHHLMLLRNFNMSCPIYHLSFKNSTGDVLIASDQTLYLISSLDVMPTRIPPDIRSFTEDDEINICQKDTCTASPTNDSVATAEDQPVVISKEPKIEIIRSIEEIQTITRDTSFHQTLEFLPLPVLRSSKIATKRQEQPKSNQMLPLKDCSFDPRFPEPLLEKDSSLKKPLRRKRPVVKPRRKEKQDEVATETTRRPVRPTARPLWGAVGAAEKRHLVLHKKV